MANVIGKRKRDDAPEKHAQFKKTATAQQVNGQKALPSNRPKPNGEVVDESERQQGASEGTYGDISIQIVTGSYERVLHGIAATIPAKLLRKDPLSTNAESVVQDEVDGDVTFSDSFLFAAHASSIRCLAISPSSDSNKRILATGSSDERINLYNLSTTPPTPKAKTALSALSGTSTVENSRNRSLGNLIHHDRAITSLHFAAKSKLFSAAEDNTIAISRTRDWTVLSSIKAPIPKPQGRPSGDTAGPGEIPAGINDFAIHPSQKLMLSVGRGERCMRLWNLMTGKKAGVLNFDRELLAQVGEGKHSTGEGRRVSWDAKGEIYVIGFEKGAVVFGIDSEPKAVIKSSPPTKFHQMRFVSYSDSEDADSVLAVSTEDGRVLFFHPEITPEYSKPKDLPLSSCIAQLGGRAAGINSRVKDFDTLRLESSLAGEDPATIVITGHSDGAVRLWTLTTSELMGSLEQSDDEQRIASEKSNGISHPIRQVGRLIGTLESGNRITCLGSFVMDGSSHGAEVNEEEELELGADDRGDSEDEEQDSE